MTPTSPPVADEDIDRILEALSAFVAREVVPRHAAHADLLDDPRRRYGADGSTAPEVRDLVAEVRQASAAAGFYQLFVPESLGGGGLGWTALYRVWEHLHRICGMTHWLGHKAVSHWVSGPSFIFEAADPALRDAVLPGLLSGETMSCFAMSEPDAGTDLWNMQTRAQPLGDGRAGWSITGTKQWITNGAEADYALVFAVTDAEGVRARRGGISAFVVRTDAPGFVVDSVIRLFGHGGGHEAVLHLEAVEVGPEALVGPLDEGLPLGLRGVNIGRIFNSAKAVGLARWAFDQAVAYARDRRTFGRPLIDHQSISFLLADCAMDIRAAHLLGLDCAARLDGGEECRKEAAMAKAYSTEMAGRVIDAAVQVHGGMGLTTEMGLAEAWQEVRIVRIADGSAEMLRRTIANQLRRGDTEV